MQDYAIQIENLSKMYKLYYADRDKIIDTFNLGWLRKPKYTEFWALKNVNLTVRKGERVALIGRNGAGKSTLLKLICGNLQPTSGSFTVNGKIQALMQLGTGFHQEYTGRQNIKASLLYNNYSEKQIRSLEDEVIDFCELGEFIDQPIKTYSQGMLARLGFSVATVVASEVLIIDEVLGAGDAYFTSKCIEKMKFLTQESGSTVIFVSHDLAAVQYLCNRAVLLNHGQITDDGATLSVIKKYIAIVRQDEEERLRAKDFKKANNKAVVLDRTTDLYNIRHISFTQKQNMSDIKIRRIEITFQDKVIREVAVGAPMDNSTTNLFHIDNFDTSTSWSESREDDKGAYRTLTANGTEAKATVYLPIDKGDYVNLCVYGESPAENSMLISVTDDNGNTLTENTVIEFGKLIPLVCRDYEKYDFRHDILDYDHKNGCLIKSITLQDAEGNKKNVFPFDGQPRRLTVECAISEMNINALDALLFINHENGTLLVADVRRYTFKEQCGNLSFEYDFSMFSLGAGNYNITFALYEELNPKDRSFQDYLLRLDRTCSFKIEERLDYALSLPMIYVPFTANAFNNDSASQTQENLLHIDYEGGR